jgi:hypothetical protein
MITISASLSKKVPLPGVEYSSQQFGCSIDYPVSESVSPDAIRERVKELYGLLSAAVDEQIALSQAGCDRPAPTQPRTLNGKPEVPASRVAQPRHDSVNGRNRLPSPNGNNGRVNASPAQCRAIFAICKAQGRDMAAVLADFNVADPKDLDVKTASVLIDRLKNGNGAAA